MKLLSEKESKEVMINILKYIHKPKVYLYNKN